MDQEYSHLFVVMMGMGVTFIGLTSIIFLTMLMGRVMKALDKRKPAPAAASTAAALSPVAVPEIASDGISDYVKLAIIAAIAQEPGVRMDRVTRIDIKKA